MKWINPGLHISDIRASCNAETPRELGRLFDCADFEHPRATLRAVPSVVGRPFFMVTGLAPLICRGALHFVS
jgi:hypothetical protein